MAEEVPVAAPNGFRLHMLALPHTITIDAFSHCAYTGKVQRFGPMMRSRGYEVFHYGIETSEANATRHFDVLKKDEWHALRIKSYMQLHPDVTLTDAVATLESSASFIGDLGNYSTPLYEEFNRRLKTLLQEHYRSTKTDLVCLPFGVSHNKALEGLDVVAVESGIGYNNSTRNWRVFESYAWMHNALAKENKNGQNYWFVVPNYFNTAEWPLSLTPKVNTVGFLGRVYDLKGCREIVEVAKRMPTVRFILCGQGDPSAYLTEPNIFFKAAIHGDARGKYLGSLVACIAPTQFVEPFCGVAVEAQLCGTPVITKDYGAQTETVEQGKTGLRCHTLADYVHGIQMALDGEFDRAYIRDRAVKLYGMYNVAKQYDYVFNCILDVHNGREKSDNGWYRTETHIEMLL